MKHFFFWVEAATWWIAWWTATLDPTKVLINGYAIDSSSINTGSITSTPTEGRGYCTSSGTLFDGCLKVDKLTQVTSDYTYLFMSFSKTFQATADRAGDYNAEPFDINAVEFPSEFNDVPFVKELASRKAENAAQKLTTETDGQGQVSAINKRIQYGILVFTIDKYYSSIDETNESFTKDALDLLNKSKWTTFITICGPSYIRSVNRKSGMVSLFSVLIDSDNASQEQMDAIKNSIQGVSPVAGENDDKGLNLATSSSLSIDLTSFGLSMRGEQNNVILSAKTLKDFSTAASNAFLLMKNPKSGVVTGIEVIPWSNNINFQLLSRLDVNLEETLCYNGPQEVSCTDSGVTVRRIRKISPVLKQFNFMSNAEHIASIESIHSDMRAKSELMHQCVIALRKVSPSSKLQHNWVENKKNPQSFSQLEAETGLVVVGESDEIEEADYNMVDAQRLLLLLEGAFLFYQCVEWKTNCCEWIHAGTNTSML